VGDWVDSGSAEGAAYSSSVSRAEFEAGVRRIKEYIAAGDAFQVVLSQRLDVELVDEPFMVYRRLRSLNPSPYMYFLELDGISIVGSSPEVLVRVEDDVVTVRPIAGTRPRGASEAEDRRLAEELLADPKERAEHLMLVDLGRNDVGRVAEYGSVRSLPVITPSEEPGRSTAALRLQRATRLLKARRLCWPIIDVHRQGKEPGGPWLSGFSFVSGAAGT
jgi:anthranilate synthase component 1